MFWTSESSVVESCCRFHPLLAHLVIFGIPHLWSSTFFVSFPQTWTPGLHVHVHILISSLHVELFPSFFPFAVYLCLVWHSVLLILKGEDLKLLTGIYLIAVWVGKWVCCLISQSVSQSVGRSVVQSVSQSVSQSIIQSVGRSVGRSVSQSVGQSVSQSVCQSVSQSLSSLFSS